MSTYQFTTRVNLPVHISCRLTSSQLVSPYQFTTRFVLRVHNSCCVTSSQLVSSYTVCAQRPHTIFRHSHQTHIDAWHLSSVSWTVCTKYASMPSLVTSQDTWLSIIFRGAIRCLRQNTQRIALPPAASWRLSCWDTHMNKLRWKTNVSNTHRECWNCDSLCHRWSINYMLMYFREILFRKLNMWR